ncbi:MAG: hypothetical protein KKF62_10560 [Bacteroidetes bacterium]|nr:hypothetical protein [Bacteroidota bacterium]MBU1113516.1 hypothetical protein [Bacteroidota bacterium]MBU1797034.1 hypothetical protein [Bacteroidota bacterium]
MEKEYDFTKGERGKFYKKDGKINLPVYLEEENLKYVEKIAKEKNLDLNTIVNKLIKENINIAQMLN